MVRLFTPAAVYKTYLFLHAYDVRCLFLKKLKRIKGEGKN